MEPVAPGTEDEIQTNISTVSKQVKKQDKFLSLKAHLPNGKYGNIFEISYNNGSEIWYCNLCECPVMGRPYHHEAGKRHQQNLQMVGNKPAPVTSTIQVAPGEPVPPGFEGEIEKIAQIQDKLDSFNIDPLIGLEYLFEIQEYDQEKKPSYLCMLCDKRGDPRTIIAHLTSYNHIGIYLQRHFPTCYRILTPYSKKYKRNWQNMLYKLAESIEMRFGRLKLHPVDFETFEERRVQYLEMVIKGPHYSEKSGFNLEELIDIEQLTKVEVEVNMNKLSEDVSKRSYRKSGVDTCSSSKRSPSPPVVPRPIKKSKPAAIIEKRKSLSSVSSISSSDLSDFDDQPETNKKDSNSSSRQYEKKDDKRNDDYYHGRGKYLMPWQRPDYVRPKTDISVDTRKQNKVDKWDEYKKLASAIESDMSRILKQHEKNPEKHPDYNDEWKKFWNKRYKELQADGKDPTNYDFKPEWIEFWNKRMIELHNAEVKVKKDALRKRLGLPEEPAPICFKITGKRKIASKDEPKERKSETKSTLDDVIIIEDKDEDTMSSKRSQSPWEEEPSIRSRSRLSRDRSRDRDYKSYRSRDRYSRDRSWERDYRNHDSVLDRDVYRYDLSDYYKPPRVMRDVTRQPVHSPPHYQPVKAQQSDEEDGEINVVGVLRLLTALEDKLGSLGPKIIDLLAQALASEKAEANSSETLLENDVNCVLFETVKEKLKGQLLAGLVEYAQEKAFKNAIKKIASLIHFAGERKKKNEKEKPKVDPVKVPGVGAVDKAAIAKQIANALVLQGKTDVTQEELEQLIGAVVGMAGASRQLNKPITTQTFLEQVQSANSNRTSVEAKSEPVTNALQALQGSNSDNNSMDGLSDSDLQTLLQNFKDLSTDEQHSLITYLKKLEAKEPERVERLRKFVNLGQGDSDKKEIRLRQSPFSNRFGGVNPTVEENFEDEDKANNKKDSGTLVEKTVEKVNLDSDEDDYSYEDVFKAATKNVKEKEMEKERLLVEGAKSETKKSLDLDDAKALIANIMGNINSKSNHPSSNLLGLGSTVPGGLTNLNNLSKTNFIISQQSNFLPNQSNFIPTQKQPDIMYPMQKSYSAAANYQGNLSYTTTQNQPVCFPSNVINNRPLAPQIGQPFSNPNPYYSNNSGESFNNYCNNNSGENHDNRW